MIEVRNIRIKVRPRPKTAPTHPPRDDVKYRLIDNRKKHAAHMARIRAFLDRRILTMVMGKTMFINPAKIFG